MQRKEKKRKHTDSLDNGGALLAHKAAWRWPVSIFHTETSLFPCDVDINHDDSVGCGIIFRIRVADGCWILATDKTNDFQNRFLSFKSSNCEFLILMFLGPGAIDHP